MRTGSDLSRSQQWIGLQCWHPRVELVAQLCASLLVREISPAAGSLLSSQRCKVLRGDELGTARQLDPRASQTQNKAIGIFGLGRTAGPSFACN